MSRPAHSTLLNSSGRRRCRLNPFPVRRAHGLSRPSSKAACPRCVLPKAPKPVSRTVIRDPDGALELHLHAPNWSLRGSPMAARRRPAAYTGASHSDQQVAACQGRSAGIRCGGAGVGPSTGPRPRPDRRRRVDRLGVLRPSVRICRALLGAPDVLSSIPRLTVMRGWWRACSIPMRPRRHVA